MSREQRHAVCLCADARMLVPALFVADAVRKSALSRGTGFDILVFVPAGDVDGTHRQWAADRGIELRHDIDTAGLHDIAILQSRLSAATLVKLLLAERLLGHYGKILYLDADLIIEGDVGALFELDMGELAVAAAPAGRMALIHSEEEKSRLLAHFRALGMTPPYRYVNTGVLLIDVENWSRQDLTRRTLEFIRKNPTICFLPDEDALNAVLDGNVLELSPLWNAVPPSSRVLPEGEIQPVIVHYIGPLKPWLRFRKGKGLFQDLHAYRLYQKFVSDTPWSGWLRQQWTLRDIIGTVRHQVTRRLKRLTGRQPVMSRAEQESRRAVLRQYYAQARFADVEQGITLREGSRLRLAPRPPGTSPAKCASDCTGRPAERRIRISAPGGR